MVRAFLLALIFLSTLVIAYGQRAKTKPQSQETRAGADADHERKRSEWFLRGRVVRGKASAELRRRAYQNKMRTRAARLIRGQMLRRQTFYGNTQAPQISDGWTPLGPVPLASDASGDGFQNYNQVSGRATGLAIDPADPTGNTVFVGGAQAGVWKSTNAAASVANSVNWSPLTDDQATLSIGSIAIQPGNSNPATSVVLAGTGEADNSADSYFGLGILRSADGGNTWTLISTANSTAGTLSFSGLGGTRMAFRTAVGQTNTVVAAMAASAVGEVDGALTSNTYPGLYTSTDAGETWTYDALFSGASEATSATSVVYNATAGLFFAALQYHGFYSSPDGLTWTLLANQPGAAGLLSTTACPQNYVTTCPMYRGEITAVPNRNEMYVWFVSPDSNGNAVDRGIWLSTNSGISWTQINDSGISNCGDEAGCGVDQGFYNLALLALPDGSTATDLYAGAINLYKCTIATPTGSPSCANPFMNLTHAYGCDPLGAPAHVHPDQHALAYSILSSGTDLMYFANDGGLYRALDGYTGLTSGSCTGTNLFDDLNQNLGSMTQFVSFSQSATNQNTILGGTQGNGSPATETATTSESWGNVLSGDGGYNAIDANTGNWFTSNPDTGSGTLDIYGCSSGVGCTTFSFEDDVVVESEDVGGDDGGFYFPYLLDPQSKTSLLVGTCRVWQGPRSGGAYTLLSPNFDTLGIGTCSGNEVNVVRALAAGGASNANGSQVTYATTDGLGPNALSTPIGGNVWVTTNAMAVSGVSSTFVNVTLNGPGGTSINLNQFPISSVAIDASDPTGNTAYVAVMGFTGAGGHVWKTTNAGASWSDFTGSGTNALPDDPVNAVVVDPSASNVYVGTDVGVFQSSTSGAAWTELGPSDQETGFLPNVAVTALAIFDSGSQKLLRASTYGRGVWEFNLAAVPDFQIAVPNSPLTAFAGTTPTFSGTVTALDGYNSSVTLSCTAGVTSPPSPCTPKPASLTPTASGKAFSVTTGSVVGTYNFNVQGVGSDSNHTTHVDALTLNVVNLILSTPSPTRITEPRGATSPAVSFTVSVQGAFNQSVTLSCSFAPSITGAACTFTPAATVNPTSTAPVNMTATMTVPASTAIGNYTVTLQATTAGAPAPFTTSFTLAVVLNPTFVISEPTPFPEVNAGSTGTSGSITIDSQDGFSGTVSLSCVSAYGANSCSVSPTSVNAFPAEISLIINGTSFAPGSYEIEVQGISGAITQSANVPFNVGTYTLTGPSSLSSAPGGQLPGSLTFTPTYFYSGQVSASCSAAALPGAKCTISPAKPITINYPTVATATATIVVPSNASPGNYNVIITTLDVTGEPTASLTIVLTVYQDFTINPPTPSTQAISPGQSAAYSFSVQPVGSSFANAITFSCSGAPVPALCTFTPNPVTPGSSSVAVVMTAGSTAGSNAGGYSLVVTGSAGSLSHSSAAVSLTVGEGFQLAVTQLLPSTAEAGSQQSAKVSLTANYGGSLNATCSSNVPASQCAVTPNPVPITGGNPATLSLLLNLPNDAAPSSTDNVVLTVADPSGQPSQNLTLPFAIVQDYAIGNFSPATQTISAGQSITYNFSVLPVGATYNNTVMLSCGFSPTYAGSCSFSPNPAGPLSDSTSASVVVTVSTPGASGQMRPPARSFSWLYAVWWAVPGIVVWGVGRKRRRTHRGLLGAALALLFLLLSCGGGGSNGGTTTTQTPPGGGIPVTYTITVTGSPASLSQPDGATATLTVQ